MILFASDLHLSPATPGLNRLFVDFLAGEARAASALYLLGDVFEYWIGDDDAGSAGNAEILAALADLAGRGVEVGFLAGNRDFLVGDGFAAATGVRLLPDPFVLSLPTWQFVLTHGDQLCTDDLAYQGFRSQVRSAEWQRQFLALPRDERRRQVEILRQKSQASKQEKAAQSPYLMDVNIGASEDLLRHYGYATLIHGHTHRPATHDHIVDGIHCERWVLSDWHEAGAASRGEVLAWRDDALHRLPVGR